MGEEDVREPSFSALRLPPLHMAPATMSSPEHPLTPPLQTLASVPFKWEEEPGKPRSCTHFTTPLIPEPAKCLGLPPCRTPLVEPVGNKITKTPSPTAVLDGPYNVGRPKFSSFRFFREGQDSLDYSPECSALDELLGSKKSGGQRTRGFFGKFKGGKKVVDGGSCRFSPPSSNSSRDIDEKCGRVKSRDGESMRRNGSFSSVSNTKPSHFLATIYRGFKQVMQWRSGRR